MLKHVVSAVVCALTLVGAVRAAGAQQTVEDEGWQFRVTPYLFLAGLDGKIGVQSITVDIDAPFGKILEHLDVGLMAVAVAKKDRWSFGIDGMYIKLSGQESRTLSGPFGNITVSGTAEVTTTQQIYQPTIAYCVVEDPRAPLDVYVAARYTSLENEAYLAITTDIPSFPGGTRTLTDEKSWWDPVIGMKTTIPFCDKFHVHALADFGGFGAGSDVTYQWLLTAGWQFARHFSVDAGYRYLVEDYEEDGFVWNVATSGMIVGLGITF